MSYYNPNYPPKNRLAEELGPIDLRIIHGDGEERVDPNEVIVIILTKKDWLLSLKPLPDTTSLLSGEPALIYRADDMAIPLTTRELYRLMTRDLFAHEFFKLRDHFGDFHDIHDDYYDHDTGVAIQSMADRTGDPTHRVHE